MLLKVIPSVDKFVKELAGTLALTPPPVRYLTVKVVFDGDIP